MSVLETTGGYESYCSSGPVAAMVLHLHLSASAWSLECFVVVGCLSVDERGSDMAGLSVRQRACVPVIWQELS